MLAKVTYPLTEWHTRHCPNFQVLKKFTGFRGKKYDHKSLATCMLAVLENYTKTLSHRTWGI